MPIREGKPPRSPHDWLCRFCTTSAGNPYRNNGFRKECHKCHLAKGEAFKAKSENREQPTKSTKESARVVALEKELARLRQAVKKPEEQSQQENDAPSRAAYKQAIQGLGKLVGVLPGDHPAIRTIRAELDQAKAASDESVPLSKRIRAGQNQIAMHERDLKAAKERVEEAERNLVSAQNGLEQSQAKALEIEKALQERKAHLEHLHRQAAAEASRGPEATPLDAILPDDLTEHLSKHWPPGTDVTFQRVMDLYLESRKAAIKDAGETGPKQGMDVDEFGELDDEIVPRTEERIQAQFDELLQAQARGESEKLAELRAQMARDFISPVPKKRPKHG